MREGLSVSVGRASSSARCLRSVRSDRRSQPFWLDYTKGKYPPCELQSGRRQQPTSLVFGYTVRLPNIRLRTNEADGVILARTNSLNTAHVRCNDQSLAEKRSRASSAHWISSMKLMSDMSHFIISVRRSFCRSRTSGRRESKSQDDGGAAKQDLGDIRVAPHEHCRDWRA